MRAKCLYCKKPFRGKSSDVRRQINEHYKICEKREEWGEL